MARERKILRAKKKPEEPQSPLLYYSLAWQFYFSPRFLFGGLEQAISTAKELLLPVRLSNKQVVQKGFRKLSSIIRKSAIEKNGWYSRNYGRL